MATYNAGLAVGVLPHTTERAAGAIEALATIDVDLLFVQEFWLESHWQALRRALDPRYPHAFRPEPVLAREAGSCVEDDVRALVDCARKHCAGLADEALARCVVERCASAALSMPTPCLNCIASHPVGTLDAIVARCLGKGPPAEPERPGALRYGGLIAYGGSFGTGLLSRFALRSPEPLVFESSVNARAALHALVAVPELGEISIFAVHLSPGGAEHGVQIERLLAFIDEKASRRPALLLGDLNATPDSTPFRALVRAGFRESDPADRRATYTSDGLVTGRIPDRGVRFDHVLVRNLSARLRCQRILDAPVAFEVQGATVRTTLSDHFGVLAELEAPTSG